MKKSILTTSRSFGGILLASLFATAGLNAAVINIDFGPTGNHPGGPTTAPYSGTAAAPDAGTVWNVLSVNDNNAAHVSAGEFGFWTSNVTVSNLVDSMGGVTGLSVTAIGSSNNKTGAFGLLQTYANMGAVAQDAVDLMRDYLIAFDDPQLVELTGFVPGTIVDLFLYGAGDTNNRNTIFAVNDINGVHTATTTGSLTPSGQPPVAHNLTLGGDYVVLSGIVADGDGKITISYDNGPGSSEGPFNGLQVVVIPEPSSALLLLGALPLALSRRRRL